MSKYTDIIFKCRKCNHHLFIDNCVISGESLAKLSNKDCPNCGEEGFENWILSREGNYEEEYASFTHKFN